MARKIALVELGCPGHFIGSQHCRFRRHTQIGDYRVSTVGDLYWPHSASERSTLGCEPDSFFETMVFKTRPVAAHNNDGCGCREVESFSEIDSRRYATAGAAQKGHEAFVAKYARLDRAGGGG